MIRHVLARCGGERVDRRGEHRASFGCTLAVTLALLVVLALPATSFGSSAPKIVSSSAGTNSDEPTAAELHASIQPNGLETMYEFWTEHEGAAVKVAGGNILASELEREVTAKISSLLPQHSYSWAAFARNMDGTVSRVGTFETFPELPAGCPYGCSSQGPVEFKIPPWVIEGAERSAREAPQREAERQARQKEEAERPAKEAAAREAAEREEREAGERAGREAAEKARSALSSQCVVPKLNGDSLQGARRALHRAHCTLGKVRGPRAHSQHLVVISQGARSGRRLAPGATVAVTLGARPRAEARR